MNRYEGAIPPEFSGRADRFLADAAGALGRSRQKALNAKFFVNGKAVKPSRLLKPGDALVVEWDEESAQDFLPEDIALDVVYEDADLVVVDKPQGMVTHPAHGNWSGTLANALLGRLRAGSAKADGPARAGIIHRLDKDTSGVIVCAKTAAAQEFVAAQFRDRTVVKEYVAIVHGRPPVPEGRIENRLGRDPRNRKRFAVLSDDATAVVGKLAVSSWKTVADYGAYSLLRLRLKTGRTHQLRVHLQSLGCPIVGDPLYGKTDPRFPRATLMLHAWKLTLTVPSTGTRSTFIAKIPERFERMLNALRAYRRNA